MVRNGVYLVLFILLSLIVPSVSAELVSLEKDCGSNYIFEQGNGGNVEYVYGNDCIELTMRKNQYDTNTEILDKLNNRYFRLMANQIDEHDSDSQNITTTTMTSMQLTSDIDDDYIRWSKENFDIGYKITGRSFKIVANITNWTYNYTNSNLWIDMRYHKNEGDILEWIPVIVDGVELPMETTNRTAGVNEFISQNIGRGYEIIIDPLYYVDHNPTPARFYANGDSTAFDYSTYNAPIDETTDLTDGNTETRITIEEKGGTDDDALRVMFEHNYTTGHQYFLRFYKRNAGDTNLLVYPHNDTETINLNLNSTLSLSGNGWFEINVTNLVIYMDSIALGHLDFRLQEEYDADKIEVSEIMLRDEINDTQTPTIHSCTTNTTSLSCNETAYLTCEITDDLDVAYASFTLDAISYLATKDDDNYTILLSPQGFATKNYAWTETEACDIFNNCATTNPAINVLYSCAPVGCSENWVASYNDVGSCNDNNTISQQVTYSDSNACGTYDDLPVDNGTTSLGYCNFCDSDWNELTGGIHECQSNSSRFVEYIDYNSCYAITGLPEDAPPYDDETWVACQYHTTDFVCSISDTPFLKDKIEYSCTLPYTGSEWTCINEISYEIYDVLQVNPQKIEKTTTFFGLKNNIESREYFTTNMGLLNAYFTPKNLVADTTFQITTTCRTGNQTLVHQKEFVPELKALQEVPTYWKWVKDNAVFLVAGFILIFFVVGMLVILLNQVRTSR